MNKSRMSGLTTALALKLAPGLLERHRNRLRSAGIEPDGVRDLTESDLMGLGWPRKLCLRFLHARAHPMAVPAIAEIMDRINAGELGAVAWSDPAYPADLLQVLSDPPPVLFARGDTALLRHPQLAIVGSRRPNPATHRLVHDWARRLADSRVVITSGLAYGVDVAAHCGALAAGSGKTIAVLAGGLDHIYPTPHRTVVRDIIQQGGLVVSEQLPDVRPRAGHFPRRNRLVAGLARATLVGQAAPRSGSLITAGLAADQGKPVLVVPDHPGNPDAHGGLQLLRDGAEPAVDWQDCLDHFPEFCAGSAGATDASDGQAQTLAEPLQRVLQSLSTVPESLESLSRRTGVPAAQLLPGLLRLELMGLVTRHRGGFQRLTT